MTVASAKRQIDFSWPQDVHRWMAPNRRREMVATRRNTGSATFFMILLNDAGASGPTYTLEDWRWWEATGGATAFPTLRMNPEAENKDPGATWAELTGAAATDVPD